jgi:ribose/xylose/arabinose/galactoside ABC-type transport system permease subunit
VWISVSLVLIIGGIFGAINGLLISRAKIPSFITTLGMGFIIFGLINIITDGNTINRLPPSFMAIGRTQIFGLPSMVYIAAVIVMIGAFILNKTTFGRSLFSCGLNQHASFLSGLSVNKTIMTPYVINGLCAAVAGILLTIRVNSAQPDMGGSAYNFEAITAAVIGGVSLFGGQGRVSGCVYGVLLIKVIENCITILNITPHIYRAVLGVIILVALIFEMTRKKSLA